MATAVFKALNILTELAFHLCLDCLIFWFCGTCCQWSTVVTRKLERLNVDWSVYYLLIKTIRILGNSYTSEKYIAILNNAIFLYLFYTFFYVLFLDVIVLRSIFLFTNIGRDWLCSIYAYEKRERKRKEVNIGWVVLKVFI